MTDQLDVTEARVYVGTYCKYNKGSLYGEWLNLSDYSDKDELYKACQELHDDEESPEFMFQYENIPDGLINESWISDKLFNVLEALKDMDTDLLEPFLIWCNNEHKRFADEDIDDLISSFQDDYIGEYNSEDDFAKELIELKDNLNEFAKRYFDYKAYARDLFSTDYWFVGGYVFQN
ncbi:MAG TPA: antirestriction protein ArdA [Bacteroidia bacterium]|nr:antirestriction protein ArdA [Bacteroidia bacterium]